MNTKQFEYRVRRDFMQPTGNLNLFSIFVLFAPHHEHSAH
jgi:hypothetical protein